MVVGQQSNLKIGLIVQARMKSERLPGKVLLPMPFPTGEPLLGIIINQLKKVAGKVIIATSENFENNILASFCQERQIECFRGSEDDVLSRFVEIQKKYDFDHILRLTADNPIIDTDVLDRFIKSHIDSGVDYSSSAGLPLGMNFEIFKGSSVILSEQYVKSSSDKEHVTLVLKREATFSKQSVNIETGLNELRLTVDTTKDFLTLGAIVSYSNLYNLEGLDLIRSLRIREPWLFEGNTGVHQKNSNIKFKDELNAAMSLLKSLDYNRVVRKLDSLKF